MRVSCIHDAKVRARLIVRHRRSFYKKPLSVYLRGRKRGLSLVRNAGHILGYADSSVCRGFLRHVGGLSLLSYESTFNTMKKKKAEERKENLRPRATGRRSLTLPVLECAASRTMISVL